jgi:hypothetical protein
MKLNNTFKKPRSRENILLFIAILILSAIIFYYKSKDINLKIAFSGWGPQDYVAHKLHPENFLKDWPNGILNYDNSLIVKIYYYLAKYVKLNPSTTVYPFMFIQTFLFLLSVVFLTQILFKNKFVSLVSATIISVSSLAGLNLSRFGLGYASLLSFPLYYGYAAAFSFFALGFYLKRRHLLSFIFLGLAVYCHINMGLFVFAFIIFYFILRPKRILDKGFLFGLILFVVMIAPHMFYIMRNANVFTGGIPEKTWILITKIFSFHWYPITMGLFTYDSYADLFPILLVLFFFFVSLRYQNSRDEKINKIISGFLACIIMTIFGVLFADIFPVPFFIKISLHRSTELITFFGVIFITNYLIKKISEGHFIKIILSVLALMTMLLARPGLAVLPMYLLLLFDIKEGYFGIFKIKGNTKTFVIILYYLSFAFIIFITTLSFLTNTLNNPAWTKIYLALWYPFHFFNPFGEIDFLLRGGTLKFPLTDTHNILLGICFLLFVVCAVFKKNLDNHIINSNNYRLNNKIRFANAIMLSTIFFLSGSIVYLLNKSDYVSWKNGTKDISISYLDAQIWAKNNTPKDSLFMPDPSHTYGWRDFSERSSFGNIREWTYTIIGYNSDYEILKKGLQRLKEFGIEVDKISEEDLKKDKSLLRGTKLTEEIRQAYYTMSDLRLKELCAKYQIDYVVFDKQFMKKERDRALFSPAFENKHYLILKPLQDIHPKLFSEQE